MELYYAPPSSPCRAVLLLLQTMNLHPEMKIVDIMKGEQMRPDYLKLNPQHTVPLIVDDNFVLSESRAILGYIAEKYGSEGQFLYPSDPMARGVVNQRLFFDQGTLYQAFLDAYFKPAMSGAEFDESKKIALLETLGWLDIFMGDSPYMAGDKMTIADFSIAATVSSIKSVGVDLSDFVHVTAWYERCMDEMSGFEEINVKGAALLGDTLKAALKLE